MASASLRVFSRLKILQKKNNNQRLLKHKFHSSVISAQKLDISGIYPPIATPFNEDESIAYDKLSENMKKWNEIPFKGYVVQGSNGECSYQSSDEKVEMVRQTKNMASSEKLIIGGSGCESTRDTIMLSQRMADAGADAVLVLNPFYYKSSMNARALMQHFTKVADACPVPVILYNVPANTGADIPPEVVVSLSAHPNIVGMKDSGGDITRIAGLCFQTQGEDFQILAGSAGFLLAAYNVGCVGGVLGCANVLGREVCQLERLAVEGNIEEARKLQHRLVGPNACVTRRFGVPGLKTALEWFGFYGGPTRSPLVPLTSDEVEIMRKIFQKSAFLS